MSTQRSEEVVAKLARGIAAGLGENWSIGVLGNATFSLQENSGLIIHGYIPLMWLDSQLKGKRLEFLSAIPRSKHCGNFPEASPRITVAADRPLEAIAKDMTRRLLPAAHEYWRNGQKWSEEQDERFESIEKIVKFLSIRHRGDPPINGRTNGRAGNVYWTAMVHNPNDITIDLRRLTAEQVDAILTTLHAEPQ